jgi:membrane protease YdiL (CAAX protease family)
VANPLPPLLFDWWPQACIGAALVLAAGVLLIRYRKGGLPWALAAALLEVGLLIGLRGLLKPITLPVPFVKSYTMVIVLVLAAGIVLSRQGWWQSAGFTGPSHWRRFRLLWFVALFLSLPALALIHGTRMPAIYGVLFAGYVLISTGAEEMFYRGIVLRATLRYGVLPAVLLSSLLFGLSHLNNLFAWSAIDLSYVLLEIWSAFLLGIFFAALRLRMNAIWAPMLAHAGYDLPGFLLFGVYAFAAHPTLRSFALTTGFGLFFAGIGWFLLRKATPSIIPTELKT